jgi:hypothetical protein
MDEAIRLGAPRGGPQQEFGEIIAAFRSSEGTIVVVDALLRNVRFFSATGQHIRTVGRQGQGPGEYQRIQSATQTAGDSIAIWDIAERRATLLAPDGRVARTVQIVPPVSAPRPGVTITGAGLKSVIPDQNLGWISVAEGVPIPPNEGPLPALVPVPILLLQHNAVGVVIDTLAVGPGHEWLFVPPLSESYQAGPFRPAEAMSPALTLKTFVRHGPVLSYVAASKAFEVRAFARDGRERWRSRYGALEEELTRSQADSLRARSLAATATPERRRALDHMTDTRWAPQIWPSLGALQTDHAGRVWVRAWKRAADADGWIVLDENGYAVAVAETPRSIAVLSVDGDYLVGLERDSMGNEYVVVAPLNRATRSPL